MGPSPRLLLPVLREFAGAAAAGAAALAVTAAGVPRLVRHAAGHGRSHLDAWFGGVGGGVASIERNPRRFVPAAPGPWCRRCGRMGAVDPGGGSCGPGCRALGDAIVVLGADEPPLSDLVRAIKRGGGDPDLGTWLGRCLGDRIITAGVLPVRGRPVVVPMPVAGPRRAGRGIDHAEVIAAGVARSCRGTLGRRILAHAGGGSQALRGRRERLQAASAAIRAGGEALPAGCVVVLVDDVRTTGATLDAAVGRLRDAGAGRVVVAVLATRDRWDAPPGGAGGEES
jgi:predicted amidophosphoribosyltransferase